MVPQHARQLPLDDLTMAETQLARGLWTGFAATQSAFNTPNGMDENLRTIDDHMGLYTLQPPVAAGTALQPLPNEGDGQIFSDGGYAVFNAGIWKTYRPRKGVRAVLAAGVESWLNTGSGWEQYSTLDTQPAIDAAVAALTPLVDAATVAAQSAVTASSQLMVKASWAELQATAGTFNGQGGLVRGDAGSHVDPVKPGGQVVASSGQYTWRSATAAWEWLSADPMDVKADKAYVDEIDLQILHARGVAAWVDGGFNVGFSLDENGVPNSPQGLHYETDRLVRGVTWAGGADVMGRAPIWTGPVEDGFRLHNPWLTLQLDRRLARAPLIAFDGDSRIDQGLDGYRTNGIGVQYWLSFLLRGRFDVRPELNFGIGGQTSAQVLARVQSTIATCKARGCTKLVALFSVNDRGNAASAGSTAAATIANLRAYQAAVLDAGIDLVWVAEIPPSNPAWQAANPGEPDYGLQPAAVLNHLAVRRWVLAQPFVHPRVQVADPFSLMVDALSAAADAKVGMLKDPKHESELGAWVIAKSLAPIFEQQLPPLSRVTSSVADVYSPTNSGGSLLANTLLTGVGGTFSGAGSHTGTLPDGWDASIASGVSAAFSTVTDADGSVWLQASLSGTAAAVTWLTLSMGIDTTALAAGVEILAVCAQQVDAGHVGLIGNPVRAVVTMGDASTPYTGAGMNTALSTDIDRRYPPGAHDGVAVSPPMAIAAGTVSAARMELQAVGRTGTALSATLRWRLPSVNRLI